MSAGHRVLAGAVSAVAAAPLAAAVVATLYRFPVPFGGYARGWSDAPAAALASAPLLARVSVWARAHWTDLYQIVRDNLFGLNGLGLKVVASAGAALAARRGKPVAVPVDG